MPRNHAVTLLSELVENALRFGRAGVPLRIRIGAEPDGGAWRLWVADNGIGIDPAYYGEIFRLFTRLQPANSPTGTGAGLAICKRIVASVRGRIWVESHPGQGSTFFFTLPRAEGPAPGPASLPAAEAC